jgi:hypothetical protein
VCKAFHLFELGIGFLDTSSDFNLVSEVSMLGAQSTKLSENMG